MEALSAKKYNEMKTAQWNKDWETAKLEGRDWSLMPQLAWYVSSKKYGYWAFNKKKTGLAYWGKTKKEAITHYSSFSSFGGM